MPRVIYSPQAEEDVRAIWRFIARDSRTHASRHIDSLNEKCRFLAENPGVGRQQPELGDGIRSFPTGNYVGYYRTEPDGVKIARILHSARDLPNTWDN